MQGQHQPKQTVKYGENHGGSNLLLQLNLQFTMAKAHYFLLGKMNNLGVYKRGEILKRKTRKIETVISIMFRMTLLLKKIGVFLKFRVQFESY